MIRAFPLMILLSILAFQSMPLLIVDLVGASPASTSANNPFFSYLTDKQNPPALVDYSPSDFDPRHGENFHLPSPLSIEKDLRKLRQVFDGLVVYSYHPDVTPVILAKAKQLHYRAVVLGIWNARSAKEINGMVALIQQYADSMTLALCLGNEGIYFHRYAIKNLFEAQNMIRVALGPNNQIPITTSEPWESYLDSALYAFGDFLAPNLHPVWVKPALPAKDAVVWVRTQAISLMEKANKPVLVKETGFPHAGERHFTPQAQKNFGTCISWWIG